MGVLKIFAIGAVMALIVANLPLHPEMNAVKFVPEEPVELKGGLAYNEKLKDSVKLFDGKIIGPESITEYKGALYTGLETGELIKIEGDKYTALNIQGHSEHAKSRFLGIRAYKDKLFTVDAKNGLYSIDLKTNKAELILSSYDENGAKKYPFMDDLDIDTETEDVYISLASRVYELEHSATSFIAYENSGSIIKYNLKTKKVEKLVDHLYFANGVQLSHDRNSLLITETFRMRALKYHLKGNKKGTLEVITHFPGCPDNIRRSPRGGYWVALAMGRKGTFLIEDLAQYPLVRKVLFRITNLIGIALGSIEKYLFPNPTLKSVSHAFEGGAVLLSLKPLHCMVVEIDDNGVVKQSLQSPEFQHCSTSEVLEWNGNIYIGSFANRYILKAKLS